MEAAAVPHSISIVIADDHRLFAEALESIVAGDPRLRVAGSARDGAEAVELVERERPDVVLMDISMPVMDGLEESVRPLVEVRLADLERLRDETGPPA